MICVPERDGEQEAYNNNLCWGSHSQQNYKVETDRYSDMVFCCCCCVKSFFDGYDY